MGIKAIAAVSLLLGGVLAVAAPSSAEPGTTYLAVAVGYQPTGIPKGVPYRAATAAEAKDGAYQLCRQRLSACAPAGTSTQCLAVATGAGTRWMSAEGPDKTTAEANARTQLIDLVSSLPLSDTLGVDAYAAAACVGDESQELTSSEANR